MTEIVPALIIKDTEFSLDGNMCKSWYRDSDDWTVCTPSKNAESDYL